MAKITGPLEAIGQIFGLIRDIIPMINRWLAAQRAQENHEKLEDIVANPDRQDAAQNANDIFRGTESKKPGTPPPASFLIFALALGASLLACTGQQLRFNPDFGVGDYQRVGITRENGVFYPANHPSFNREFCMDQAKVWELSELLGNVNGVATKSSVESRNFLGELKTDARSNEKKQWVGATQDETQRWMLELRRNYFHNRERNDRAGILPSGADLAIDAIEEAR